MTTTEGMEVLEPCVWSAPNAEGYVRVARRKTLKEFSKEIIESFGNLYPESRRYGCHGDFEWFGKCVIFKYDKTYKGWSEDAEIPNDASFYAYCKQGSNEGYIVNMVMEAKDRESIEFIVGKCFDRDFAWKACRQLAELVGAM